MKKIVLVAFTALLAFSACKKDDKPANPSNNNNDTTNNTPPPAAITVPEVNIAMVNKVTGSVCPPCGSWGWTTFEDVIATGGKKAAYIGTYSDNFVAKLFITTEASAMNTMWGVNSYPTFVVNGVSQTGNTVQEIGDKTKAAVQKFGTEVVFVNSGLRTSITGDSMTIETKTKFFNDVNVNGDLYLAVYLTEDKVKGAQSGHPDGANAMHHQVLRGAAKLDSVTKAEPFGYKISGGLVAKGTTMDNKFKINVAGYNKDNLSVTVVIWRKLGVRYNFINANTNQKH